MENKTITVNGTVYDAMTGLPVERASAPENTPKQPRKAASSHAVHRQMEASRTTHRRVVTTTTPPSTPTIQKRSDMRQIVRPTEASNSVFSRFAPQPSKATNRPRMMNDIRPVQAHPIAEKASSRIAHEVQVRHAPAAIKPSAIIKQEAISEALDKAPHHDTIKPKRTSLRPRMLSFASVALSLVLLAGYLTYINLPNLSVRVAANQAGIEAGYPGYRPDGYRLAGVNYDLGSVSLKFAANAGPQNFTLTQQQTSWDSTAVKENYVKTHWGDDVVPYSERGLTIYASGGNAVWVNGGILYTITGDAPLSASQVRSIATSL